MKRIFLSLLICSICLSAFAQIDTSKKNNPGNSDKWEIIKGNAKSSTGKLFVTLPKGTEWDMTIYAAGTNKVLSNTSLKTSFTLRPGTYDLEINKIRINGVPVEKGNNTRLKAGVLHITTSDSWTLYDEPKKIVLINSLSPQERGLPIGKYKLTILGQVQDIEITDEAPGQENIGFIESSYNWIITPLEAMTTGMGKLSIIIPKDTTITVFNNQVTFPYNILDTIRIYEPDNSYSTTIINLPKYLMTKTYNISLNRVWFTVPVKSGKETRIKAGFLTITKKYRADDMTDDEERFLEKVPGGENIPEEELWPWKLERVGGSTIATGKKQRRYALPPGEYRLMRIDPDTPGIYFHYKIIIKDGEWVKNGVRL